MWGRVSNPFSKSINSCMNFMEESFIVVSCVEKLNVVQKGEELSLS